MATQEILMPHLGQAGEQCSSCGAVLATDQRYCLNCGHRRADARVAYAAVLGLDAAGSTPPPSVAAPAAAVSADPPAKPGTTTLTVPRWWPAGLAGGAIALLFGGAMLGSALSSPEITVPQAKAPVVNVGATPSAPAAAPAAAAPAAFTSDWSGEDGWTIQLQTLDKASSDAAAVEAAKTAATGKGATDVGALDTDEYASLDPGQYVIYSGTYASKKEAEAALEGLQANFPDATVIEVSATGDGASGDGSADTGDAPQASKSDLEKLESKSGDDFVKESKKLPDEVATDGATPKADDKAPGGDAAGDAEVIE